MQFNVIYLEFMYFMVLRLYDERQRANEQSWCVSMALCSSWCRFLGCWNDMKLSWMYKISHFSPVFVWQSTKIEQNTNVTRQSVYKIEYKWSFRLVALAFASFFRHNHCLSFQYAKVWQNEWMKKMCAVTLKCKSFTKSTLPLHSHLLFCFYWLNFIRRSRLFGLCIYYSK